MIDVTEINFSIKVFLVLVCIEGKRSGKVTFNAIVEATSLDLF